MLQPIITLVTDFGQKDHYVGVMKGVILGINRSARLVDICHEIPAQDVRAAAYVLFASYRHFPKDTIHCAVVDPGVGSERKALILKTDRHLFVGPDNGIFSMICNQEKEIKVYSIHTSKDLFSEISGTFHGRDIFAPVSAYLSTGRACSELGKPVSKFVSINTLRPDTEGSVMKGAIIHVDRFGNLITNICRRDFDGFLGRERFEIAAGDRSLADIVKTYSDAPAGKIVALFGSAGHLEISAVMGSASGLLHLGPGDRVLVHRL